MPSSPFSPWTPGPPATPANENAHPSRSRDGPWRAGTGYGGAAAVERWTATQGVKGGRPALATMAGNQIPALGLASPFTPTDQTSIWGPPAGLMADKQKNMQSELSQAYARIVELEQENSRLKEMVVNAQQQTFFTQYAPSEYMSTPSSGYTPLGYDQAAGPSGLSGYLGGLRLLDAGAEEGFPPGSSSTGTEGGEYRPPRGVHLAVLRGIFNFSDMRDHEIRAVVWVIAHAKTVSNLESSSLKSAVSNLATRFSLGATSTTYCLLVRAVLEWAKILCFTSCGNYLCQQLLERGELADKQSFISCIKDDIVEIASDKFGTHVVCKAVALKELETTIANALIGYGIFESFKTGARRLWREYLEKCRMNRYHDIFTEINESMSGRWAELACTNEHGSIAVQQVFEVFPSQDMMEPCFKEIIAEIAVVANDQSGHYVITKLLDNTRTAHETCEAVISSYPPVATTHHGVNFVKLALGQLGRPGFVKYIDAICDSENGKTPGIVAIATASVGKAHLTVFILSYLTPQEQTRIRNVCKNFSTTLRNSQSGNDLLRSLGLIQAVGSRYRSGSTTSG